ncbi:MAG: nucleotidyltransferase family protein [Methylobacter sp.]|nr:nucleotidyltransferase family protein [Methylobacter sp.]
MVASSDNVYAIILAAGASRRLGTPKQLLQWRGRYLLSHAVACAGSVLAERIIVVLGAESERIQAAVNLTAITTVVNSAWQDGMSTSIHSGIAALPDSAEAALILLCDQPLIGAKHLHSLVKAWQSDPDRIAASWYSSDIGAPALFPAAFFEKLFKLDGDRGARRVLTELGTSVSRVPLLPEAALDIDRSEDFHWLLNEFS